MATPLTSEQRRWTQQLAARLNEHFDTAESERLQKLSVKLIQWLVSTADDRSPPAELTEQLIQLCNGQLHNLAEIQEAVAELTDDNIGADRCTTLIASLTRDFADDSAPPSPVEDVLWDRDFLQKIINTIADPLFVKDENHRWVLLNDACCEFMGYPREQLLGKSDYDFVPEEQADEFWKNDDLVFATGEPDVNEETLTDADGAEHTIITKKTRFIDSRGHKFLVGLVRDITEQRRLEKRLEVARRLMSLGTLAGGIAHEVNNPLSFVLTNLDYLLETLDDPDEPEHERRSALDAALRGAHRVREIVEGLSMFSEASDEDLSRIDVAEVLKSTVSVAASDINKQARLVENYEPTPPIRASERSLHQIFFNLLVNATDALDDGDPGEDEIRVATGTDDDGDAVVEISDTGEGIPEPLHDQIFDPFFTTKPVGEGTGLGLAICHSLVAALNGHIDVDSIPGEGTTFRLTFPAAGPA